MTEEVGTFIEDFDRKAESKNRIQIDFLRERPGVWAVLRKYKRRTAWAACNGLRRVRANSDFEFAAKTDHDTESGSVLYGRYVGEAKP